MVSSGNDVAFFELSGATPSVLADAVPEWETKRIEKLTFSGHPNTNNIQLVIDQLNNDPDFAKFLNTYLTEDAGGDVQEVTLEDNTKESTSSSGSDPELLCRVFFGIEDGYRMAMVFPCKITVDSGNIDTTGGQFIRRTITVQAVKATKAVTLPSTNGTVYPTTHCVLPGTTPSKMPLVTSIAIGKSGAEMWLEKGSKAV